MPVHLVVSTQIFRLLTQAFVVAALLVNTARVLENQLRLLTAQKVIIVLEDQTFQRKTNAQKVIIVLQEVLL